MTLSLQTRAAATGDAVRRGAGESASPWQLVRLLGSGAWTRVYQARPRDCPAHWPADYALKLIKRPSPDEQLAATLLRREAEVGRGVSHPHLTSVLSANLAAPPFYLVMPFLAGATLQEMLDAGLSAPLPHVLWIARQTAEALWALHARGWLHGDVKPSNVLVSRYGHATLIDLGFARRVAAARAEAAGPWIGSPSYAAPEVFSSRLPATERSDLYSLGVLLYRMLTGRLPFESADPPSLAAAHLQQIPPEPRALAPHLPRRVAVLLKRMLAKEPLRRPDAAELVATLADLEIDVFSERPT